MKHIELRRRPSAGRQRINRVARLALVALENRTLPSVSGVASPGLFAVDPNTYDPTHVLVRLRDGAPAAALGAGAERLDGQLFRVTLAAGVTVPQAVQGYGARPDVLFAEPDYQVRLTSAAAPSDAGFPYQWALSNNGVYAGTPGDDIGARTAWGVSTGQGRVIVAEIDSGVDYTHPDLAANIWTNPNPTQGDVHGYDFVNNDPDPMDDAGHGTHVAGIIGAKGDNGFGVAGVDWNVQIMPLKFLNAGGMGLMSNAVRAINYAVAHGAQVVNMSFGGTYDAAMRDAMANARSAGVIFVVAAGNDARNTDVYPVYPADYPLDNIISVAAVDNNFRLAPYSNYGATSVKIAAPGSTILSTLPHNNYGGMNGTSMAAPFVTGAIALVRELEPTWSYQQVIQQVLGTVTPVAGLQGKVAAGGVLNVGRALATLTPATTTTRPTPSDATGARVTAAVFSGAAAGTVDRVRLSFSEAIDPASFTPADVAAITGPAGPIGTAGVTVTPVAGSGNTQFDVAFPAQALAGTYQVALGADVRDLAGNPLDQNGNGVNGEAGDGYTAGYALTAASVSTVASANVPQPVLDQQTAVSTLTVNQDLTIRDLNVRVNIAHSYDGDLVVILQAPTGQQITLMNRRGGSGDNVTAVFDDQAGRPVAAGAAPFAGSFQPETPLSALNGANARGTWMLFVADKSLRDQGTLNGWSLEFTSGAQAQSASAAGGRAAAVPGRPAAIDGSSLPEAEPISVWVGPRVGRRR